MSSAQPAPPVTSLAPAPRLTFDAYGTPAPQGSKRHVGKGILIDHNPASLRTWREDVKYAALQALDQTPAWHHDYPAVLGRFVFTMPRPRSHYRTGKNAHLLRDGAPCYHHTRPDLDKLLRSTWDALTTAGVYADDSRLVQVFATKVYPLVPGHIGDPDALTKPGVHIVLHGVTP